MNTKKEIRDDAMDMKSLELVGRFSRLSPTSDNKWRLLQELFLEMADFAQQNIQTEQERSIENQKAYQRMAGWGQ